MAFKSLLVGIVFDDRCLQDSCIDYAARFAAAEGAHLSVTIGIPIIAAPSAMSIPQARALLHEVNEERRSRGELMRVQLQAHELGIVVDCKITQDTYLAIQDQLVSASRVSDLIFLSPSSDSLSAEQDLVRAVLFMSGRPVMIVPSGWNKPPACKTVAIAWDGGTRAARAVGDAMPFPVRADQIEIICITPDREKSIAGAELATNLARHCRSVTVTDLAQAGDVGTTIRNHAKTIGADLIVMGAYAHSRLWEFILGGATRDALENAQIPTLFSH